MKRLIERIEYTANPSVVGLDPTVALIPPKALASVMTIMELAEVYYNFNVAIIDAIADIVPAVKPQVAMYEALGPDGVYVYQRTCQYAQSKGLYVVGDIKRGDIGSTAQAYASHISTTPAVGALAAQDVWHEDCVTINPYLGSDSIYPFVQAGVEHDKDIFVLVKTSNPSSADLQNEMLTEHDCTVSQRVAQLVEQWGSETRDEHTGYSRVGAVVGATHPHDGEVLRQMMPHTFFLVPGYGAQGGTAADLVGFFDAQGSGVLVNSSRGIIGAWKKHSDLSDSADAQDALRRVGLYAQKAALAMKDDISRALASF